MSEFFYNNVDDEPVTYKIDKNKQKEINETLFQFLRDTGVSSPDDVTSDLDREEAALEMLEKLVELLEIEPSSGEL